MEYQQKRQPLLYVDQPSMQAPEARMQQQYYQQSCVNGTRRPAQEDVKNKSDMSFKHLSIAGQINYLLTGPEEIPAIRCEIFTKSNKYLGVITGQNENDVVLRVIGRPHQFIPKQDIIKIRLIGF